MMRHSFLRSYVVKHTRSKLSKSNTSAHIQAD